jgi:hypothetical protein
MCPCPEIATPLVDVVVGARREHASGGDETGTIGVDVGDLDPRDPETRIARDLVDPVNLAGVVHADAHRVPQMPLPNHRGSACADGRVQSPGAVCATAALLVVAAMPNAVIEVREQATA